MSEQSELFDCTVSENVSYANPDADEAKIHEALYQAALDDETDFSLREAGENGSKLSGGQRQRVAIARALLKDAPLVILDEPNASLDTVSEKKVLETIIDLKNQGKAIIIITHRESTMKIADRFLLINDRRIVDNLSQEAGNKGFNRPIGIPIGIPII